MTRATVFGLDVWSDEPIEMLAGARAHATGRHLVLTLDRQEMPAREWPPGTELIGRHIDPNGRTVFAVQADVEEGWRLSGEGYGEHWLSADGLRLMCRPAGASAARWQRFLLAQVLPFAASANGLEVLHASAVVIDGAAVALLGPSGSGKTTLALALCDLGAGFLADDVLALEPAADRLLAHPGTPRVAVKIEGEGEGMVRVAPAEAPAPLAAVVLLERGSEGPLRPVVEPLAAGRDLLATTFNLILRDGARASRLLEVCALAARERALRLRTGPHASAAELAESLIGALRATP
jgi:HPr kinase/phosphorylase